MLLFTDTRHRIYELDLVKHSAEAVLKPDWSTFRVR